MLFERWTKERVSKIIWVAAKQLSPSKLKYTDCVFRTVHTTVHNPLLTTRASGIQHRWKVNTWRFVQISATKFVSVCTSALPYEKEPMRHSSTIFVLMKNIEINKSVVTKVWATQQHISFYASSLSFLFFSFSSQNSYAFFITYRTIPMQIFVVRACVDKKSYM